MRPLGKPRQPSSMLGIQRHIQPMSSTSHIESLLHVSARPVHIVVRVHRADLALELGE
jgi:hypothetical protein